MCSLKGINGVRLGKPNERMSIQWPDKLFNRILWMVLDEKRGDLVRHGDELWKGSAIIKKNVA